MDGQAMATASTDCSQLRTEFTPEGVKEAIRQNWSIENRLHWRLDMVKNEDQGRTRQEMAHHLAVLRHMDLDTMQKEGSKGSLRGKFKRPDWGDRFSFKLLEAF
jgi:predicted transposase YbfD/YdcC